MTRLVTSAPWRDPVAAHRLMTAIVALMVVASFVIGERIVVADGLGWDGVTYAALVRDLDRMVREGALDLYYAQRVLPAAIVRAVLISARASFSTANIIVAFQVLNGALTIIAVLIWRRIADAAALDVPGRWLGFTGLFMTFAFSKQGFFYPVLTDTMAWLLALLLLLAHLRRSLIGLVLTSLVGAFCWPTLAVTGAILIFFLPAAPSITGASDQPRAIAWPAMLFSKWLWTIATLLIALVFFSQLPIAPTCVFDQHAALGSLVPPAVTRLLARHQEMGSLCTLGWQFATAVPALLLVAAAIAVLLYPLLGEFDRRSLHSRQRLIRAGIAVATLAASWAEIRLIANPALPVPSNIVLLARLSLFPAPGKVLLPLVSAAAFWGPALLVAILAWPGTAIAARRLGPGIAIAIAVTLPFALVGEPRFLTTIWPMIVLSVVLLLNRLQPDRRFYTALIVSAILLAQFWLPMNLFPWRGGNEMIFDFPRQLWFMHFGLWMTWPSYFIQMVSLTAIGWWLRTTLVGTIRRS